MRVCVCIYIYIYIYTCVCVYVCACVCVCVCNRRSIFLTGLNSEFSFSLTGCHIKKTDELYYLFIARSEGELLDACVFQDY